MDVTTLLSVNVAASFFAAATLALIGRNYRSPALALGALGLACIGWGLLALALRASVGEVPSILVGNVLVSCGLAILSEAVAAFQQRRILRRWIWPTPPVLFFLLLANLDDAQARIVFTSAAAAAQALILAAVVLSGRKKTPGWGWQLIFFSSLLYVISFTFRGVLTLNGKAPVFDLFSQSFVQSQAFVVSLIGLISLAIGFTAIHAGQVEDRLRHAEQKSRSIVENANDVIYTLDLEGLFNYVSPKVFRLQGRRAEALIGKHFSSIIHPLDLPACREAFDRVVLRNQHQVGLECRVNARAKGWRWYDTNVVPMLDSDGKVSGVLGIGRDINDRKLLEAQLSHQAHYDALTGLPNRVLILDRLDQAVRLARRRGSLAAIMFIDLDRFKEINDQHGHATGDAALQEVASRLTQTLRDADSVGRLGGDEFLVVLSDIGGLEDVRRAAWRIEGALSAPIKAGSLSLTTGCSIGIACFPAHGAEAEDILRKADAAMYAAKRSGGGVQCAQTGPAQSAGLLAL